LSIFNRSLYSALCFISCFLSFWISDVVILNSVQFSMYSLPAFLPTCLSYTLSLCLSIFLLIFFSSRLGFCLPFSRVPI